MKKIDDDKLDDSEDVTKYGEFVSSYFAWLSLSKQKQITKKLEDISNKKQD